MTFLTSTGGEFLVQSVFHSLVITFIVEALIQIWDISKPSQKLKFYLTILWFPIVSWPIYQLIYPQRGSQAFRDGMVLVDLSRWLRWDMGGLIPLWYIFIFFLAVATFLSIVQELAPELRRLRHRGQMQPVKRGQFPKLDWALGQVAISAARPAPSVFVIDHGDPMVQMVGMVHPGITLSPLVLDLLDEEELEGVLAHEMAHLIRGDNRTNWGLLILRMLMLFNPVALFVSRRIAQMKEEACDDLAATFTQKPLALASGLIKVFRGGKASLSFPASGRKGWPRAWGRSTRQVLVEERVRRLLDRFLGRSLSHEMLRLGITVTAMAGLLFFVV